MEKRDLSYTRPFGAVMWVRGEGNPRQGECHIVYRCLHVYTAGTIGVPPFVNGAKCK
jgi:hypothetical protein